MEKYVFPIFQTVFRFDRKRSIPLREVCPFVHNKYFITSVRASVRAGEIFLAFFPFFSMTFVFGTDLRPGPRDTKDTISRVPRPPREQLIFFQSYIYWSDILV